MTCYAYQAMPRKILQLDDEINTKKKTNHFLIVTDIKNKTHTNMPKAEILARKMSLIKEDLKFVICYILLI